MRSSGFPQGIRVARDANPLWKTLVAAVIVLGLGACADDAGAPMIGAAPDAPLTGPQGRVGSVRRRLPVVALGVRRPDRPSRVTRVRVTGTTSSATPATNADSTYESLVAGDTTCTQRLDTATYWAPSLLDGEGRPIEPLSATAYYRAGAGVDPAVGGGVPAGADDGRR